MKSPFPGMDPYIEASDLWGDFHSGLIAEMREALCEALPQQYFVRSGYREYTDLILDASGHPRPTSVVVADETAPLSLRAFIEDDHREKFLDIFELHPERRLVTTLEILSPGNKKRGGAGWRKYLRRRRAFLRGKAHFVEIDLVRGGDRMPMLDPWPASPYTLLVTREQRAPYCRVWPAFFDRPLPAIPVPLSRPDPDVVLNLQSLVDAVYTRGRYGEEIDYTVPLTPPLTPEQTAWLEGRLRARS